MIAVVGNPVGTVRTGGIDAAGLPVAVARAAVAAGGAVQLIGKVGEGSGGDAILLSLAADGIGHAALLRDPGSAGIEPEPDSLAPDLGDGPLDELAGLDGSVGSGPGDARTPSVSPTLEAADLELALRYLPDYDVVVIAQPLDAAALGAVADATRWAGAHLIVLGGADAAIPDAATLLEPPEDDVEGAFATLVGRYAAALDTGTPADQAFADASAAAGWVAAAAD